MSEHRHYTVTLNYYDEIDMAELLSLLSKTSVDYYAWCFEGCDRHHAHLHLSVHFKSSVPFTTFQRYFTKAHHIEPVKDAQAMHDYIRGYQGSVLKCALCSHTMEYIGSHQNGQFEPCNVYFTHGPIPKNGRHKTPATVDTVIQSVNQGKTMSELTELYPAYMLSNRDKIHRLVLSRSVVPDTSFYHVIPDEFTIQMLQEFYPGFVLLRQLPDIELYDSYTTVVYWPEEYTSFADSAFWALEVIPISYRFGYQTRFIKPLNFIIVTKQDLPGYELIQYEH